VIRFRLPPNAIDQVAVVYSPLFETVLSLKVLAQPRHHPLHHPWLREMRRLRPELRRGVAGYAFAYQSYVPVFLYARSSGGFDSFESDLERLQEMPREELRFEFTRFAHVRDLPADPSLLDDPARRRQVLERARDVPADSRRLLERALEETDAFVEGFVSFLRSYWRGAFRREWERIEPQLAETVAAAGKAIARDGLYGFLEQISPRIRVDARRQQVLVEKWYEADRSIGAGEMFVLAPSVYVWPHLLVSAEGSWPPGISYAAPFLAAEAPSTIAPPDLVRLLRALADDTRLGALRLIAQQPRSTQELAPLVGINQATLSRHLRVLSEAGVLSRARDGRFVLYRLDVAALERLQPSLSSFLRSDPR
jgi:DNA-binding transcriptional ArsR family regulator